MRWANLARDAEKIAHYECYPEWIELGEEYFESCTEGSSAYLKLWWNTASSRSDNALKTHLIAQMDIYQEGEHVLRVWPASKRHPATAEGLVSKIQSILESQQGIL